MGDLKSVDLCHDLKIFFLSNQFWHFEGSCA